MTDSPSINGSSGRDVGGRFLPNNSFGKGNPFAGRIGQWRRALVEVVTDELLRGVVKRLVASALQNERWAVQLLLAYTLGRPVQPLELLDGDETPVIRLPVAGPPAPTPPPSGDPDREREDKT
jgi:hypothetical protein